MPMFIGPWPPHRFTSPRQKVNTRITASNEYERDIYYFMESYGGYNEIIAQGNATTDENGKVVLTLPTDLSKYKTGAIFTLESV